MCARQRYQHLMTEPVQAGQMLLFSYFTFDAKIPAVGNIEQKN